MTPLPIDSYLPEIVRQLGRAKSLVIVAEPGAGKTTRVPPAIVRSGILPTEHPNLVMLQPRRVAARAAAQRIGEENGWKIGREVGYQIRFEKRIGRETRLRVLTEGVLTRQMLDDPFLEGVGAVILDEFHERSLNVDLAVAMLREMQQTVRGDLLLIIMSATLEAQTAARFLGGCPVVNVPGRTFGVEIEYQPRADLAVAVEETIGRADGDVLVFLPGAEEIRRVMRELEPAALGGDFLVLPLHGSLPAEAQTLALRPSAKRKVILATNIAETSLTIEGVRWVIDGGLARVPAFDPRRGMDRLELKRISKASATQRAGRAGRTGPGKCVRLWSAKEQAALEDFELPEVQRVDLCGAVLDLHAWGKPDASAFGWFESPPAAGIVSARRLLEMLGAVDARGVTAMGKRLISLPLHPRIGRLLCAAAEAGCAEEGAALAALLSEKDIRLPNLSEPPHRSGVLGAGRRGPSMQGDSDLLIRMDDLAEAERQRFAAHLRDSGIDPVAARQVARTKEELRRIAQQLGNVRRKEPSHETLLKLMLWAYPDRVCRRREGDRAAAAIAGGGGVRLAAESVVRQSEFFLALDARDDLRSDAREALAHIASAIQVEWLEEMFPDSISRERTTIFDERRQRVVGRGVVRYRDLVLSEESDAPVDPVEAGKVLAAALRPGVLEIFGKDKGAANFLERVALLRRWMPEYSWPAFDENELGDLLGELCAGKRSLEEVLRVPLAEALEGRLVFPLNRVLGEQAPEAIEVPSGSRIRLEYGANQGPILAVRLQEIFSWRETPRIAGGRVAVLLHLLGPNFRPVQITDDLKSFWSTTYFQVRKDLRVRYPKHSWPEDPLSALPQAKGRHRER